MDWHCYVASIAYAEASACAVSISWLRSVEGVQRRTFKGILGHKRHKSISVSSTAVPTISLQLNKSALLHMSKEATLLFVSVYVPITTTDSRTLADVNMHMC